MTRDLSSFDKLTVMDRRKFLGGLARGLVAACAAAAVPAPSWAEDKPVFEVWDGSQSGETFTPRFINKAVPHGGFDQQAASLFWQSLWVENRRRHHEMGLEGLLGD